MTEEIEILFSQLPLWVKMVILVIPVFGVMAGRFRRFLDDFEQIRAVIFRRPTISELVHMVEKTNGSIKTLASKEVDSRVAESVLGISASGLKLSTLLALCEASHWNLNKRTLRKAFLYFAEIDGRGEFSFNWGNKVFAVAGTVAAFAIFCMMILVLVLSVITISKSPDLMRILYLLGFEILSGVCFIISMVPYTDWRAVQKVRSFLNGAGKKKGK